MKAAILNLNFFYTGIYIYIYLVIWLSSSSTYAVVYQISSKSDNLSLRYGDCTIFKMADFHHFEF